MGMGTRFGKVAAATVSGATITWTSNEPTASYTYTIANGNAVTSTETGQAIKTLDTQMTAVIADLAAMRTLLNDGL
jgi:hypothetical protein